MARRVGKSSVRIEGATDDMKKVYVNVGVTTLMIGNTPIEPGTEFSAALKPEFEQQMLMGGHLALKTDSKKPAEPPDPMETPKESKARDRK